jgi:Cys-tRNA(Pro)/Cys-tRNA(Cys) deacylase
MPPKPPKKTLAARLLDSLGLAYELVAYAPGPNLSATEAAAEMNLPLEVVYKTILAIGDRTGPFFACLAAEKELDLKALALAVGDKKVILATVKELTALTGYLRGGCSPLGGLKKYPVFLDEDILLWDKIAINAGARGRMFLMRPADLLVATEGVVGPFAKNILK